MADQDFDDNDVQSDYEESSSNTGCYIAIGVVVLLIVGGAALYLLLCGGEECGEVQATNLETLAQREFKKDAKDMKQQLTCKKGFEPKGAEGTAECTAEGWSFGGSKGADAKAAISKHGEENCTAQSAGGKQEDAGLDAGAPATPPVADGGKEAPAPKQGSSTTARGPQGGGDNPVSGSDGSAAKAESDLGIIVEKAAPVAVGCATSTRWKPEYAKFEFTEKEASTAGSASVDASAAPAAPAADALLEGGATASRFGPERYTIKCVRQQRALLNNERKQTKGETEVACHLKSGTYRVMNKGRGNIDLSAYDCQAVQEHSSYLYRVMVVKPVPGEEPFCGERLRFHKATDATKGDLLSFQVGDKQDGHLLGLSKLPNAAQVSHWNFDDVVEGNPGWNEYVDLRPPFFQMDKESAQLPAHGENADLAAKMPTQYSVSCRIPEKRNTVPAPGDFGATAAAETEQVELSKDLALKVLRDGVLVDFITIQRNPNTCLWIDVLTGEIVNPMRLGCVLVDKSGRKDSRSNCRGNIGVGFVEQEPAAGTDDALAGWDRPHDFAGTPTTGHWVHTRNLHDRARKPVLIFYGAEKRHQRLHDADASESAVELTNQWGTGKATEDYYSETVDMLETQLCKRFDFSEEATAQDREKTYLPESHRSKTFDAKEITHRHFKLHVAREYWTLQKSSWPIVPSGRWMKFSTSLFPQGATLNEAKANFMQAKENVARAAWFDRPSREDRWKVPHVACGTWEGPWPNAGAPAPRFGLDKDAMKGFLIRSKISDLKLCALNGNPDPWISVDEWESLDLGATAPAARLEGYLTEDQIDKLMYEQLDHADVCGNKRWRKFLGVQEDTKTFGDGAFAADDAFRNVQNSKETNERAGFGTERVHDNDARSAWELLFAYPDRAGRPPQAGVAAVLAAAAAFPGGEPAFVAALFTADPAVVAGFPVFAGNGAGAASHAAALAAWPVWELNRTNDAFKRGTCKEWMRRLQPYIVNGLGGAVNTAGAQFTPVTHFEPVISSWELTEGLRHRHVEQEAGLLDLGEAKTQRQLNVFCAIKSQQGLAHVHVKSGAARAPAHAQWVDLMEATNCNNNFATPGGNACPFYMLDVASAKGQYDVARNVRAQFIIPVPKQKPIVNEWRGDPTAGVAAHFFDSTAAWDKDIRTSKTLVCLERAKCPEIKIQFKPDAKTTFVAAQEVFTQSKILKDAANNYHWLVGVQSRPRAGFSKEAVEHLDARANLFPRVATISPTGAECYPKLDNLYYGLDSSWRVNGRPFQHLFPDHGEDRSRITPFTLFTHTFGVVYHQLPYHRQLEVGPATHDNLVAARVSENIQEVYDEAIRAGTPHHPDQVTKAEIVMSQLELDLQEPADANHLVSRNDLCHADGEPHAPNNALRSCAPAGVTTYEGFMNTLGLQGEALFVPVPHQRVAKVEPKRSATNYFGRHYKKEVLSSLGHAYERALRAPLTFPTMEVLPTPQESGFFQDYIAKYLPERGYQPRSQLQKCIRKLRTGVAKGIKDARKRLHLTDNVLDKDLAAEFETKLSERGYHTRGATKGYADFLATAKKVLQHPILYNFASKVAPKSQSARFRDIDAALISLAESTETHYEGLLREARRTPANFFRHLCEYHTLIGKRVDRIRNGWEDPMKLTAVDWEQLANALSGFESLGPQKTMMIWNLAASATFDDAFVAGLDEAEHQREETISLLRSAMTQYPADDMGAADQPLGVLRREFDGDHDSTTAYQDAWTEVINQLFHPAAHGDGDGQLSATIKNVNVFDMAPSQEAAAKKAHGATYAMALGQLQK